MYIRKPQESIQSQTAPSRNFVYRPPLCNTWIGVEKIGQIFSQKTHNITIIF